jgi:hypothetical protein
MADIGCALRSIAYRTATEQEGIGSRQQESENMQIQNGQ